MIAIADLVLTDDGNKSRPCHCIKRLSDFRRSTEKCHEIQSFLTRHVQATYALMSWENNEECNLSVKKPFNVRSQIHSSSLSGLLFNVTNNKVKIKPSVIYQSEVSYFFICPTLDFHWCSWVFPCTSRTFRRLVRKKGGINSEWQDTRIFPLTLNAKILISKRWKTTQDFFTRLQS